MKKHLPFFVSVIFLITLSACVKHLEAPEKIVGFNPKGGLPLLYSTVSFADIKKPSDNSFRIAVDDSLGYYVMIVGPLSYSFPEAGTLINLAKNGIFKNNFPAFPIADSPQKLPTISYSIPLDLAQGDTVLTNSEIKNVFLSDGNLELEMVSTLPNTVNISVTFPSITNKSTATPLKLDYQLNNGTVVKKTQNLKNYKLALTGADSLKFVIDATVANAQPSPTSFGTLKINSFSLSNLKWERIEGKIGDLAFPLGSDQIAVNSLLIRPFASGDNASSVDDIIVYFEDPSMKITFQNSFGLAAKLIVNPFISFDKDSLKLADQSLAISETPFILTKPNDPFPSFSTIGFPSTSTGLVKKEILKPMFYKGPKYIAYGLTLSISGANTTDNDFILSTSKIQSETEIKLPLFGYLDNFKIESDIEAPDFSSLNSSASGSNFNATLNKASLLFNFENKIPIDINASIGFLDASDVPIPNVSLIVTISGGQLDGSGSVTNATISSARADLTTQQFEQIKNSCKKIRLTGAFKTKGVKDLPLPLNVKFYPSNNLKMQMSIYAEGQGEYIFDK